jgi:hypothetical protein
MNKALHKEVTRSLNYLGGYLEYLDGKGRPSTLTADYRQGWDDAQADYPFYHDPKTDPFRKHKIYERIFLDYNQASSKFSELLQP